MTTRLILICHASTDAVRKAAFPADEPLDQYGRTGAAALVERLPHADQSRTSPELRTRQTAQALQLNAIPEPALHDCNYGAWQGLTLAEVTARHPEAVSSWLRDPAAAPHGGESLRDLSGRIGRWLEGENATNRTILVVTHAAIIRAAIVHAIEAAPQSFWRIDIAPLSMTRLSGAKGRWNLVSAGCNLEHKI
jgi:broad specificity phosphatase PhoE